MKSVNKEFFGKTALITGGGRGIGLCIANNLASDGASVIIADVDEKRGLSATQILKANGSDSNYIKIDLSTPGAGTDLTDKASSVTGKIDILINNVRSGRRVTFEDESEDNWNLTFDVGLKSAFFCSQSVIKLMSDKGGCSIVNIGSVAGQQVTMESPSYHASKAGLIHLTKYLAVAGGKHNARVNCIVPGLIVQEEHRHRFNSVENETYRTRALRYHPLGEVGAEDDVAALVVFLCTNRARYISGACVLLDGASTTQEPWALLLNQLTTSSSPKNK